MALLQYFNYPGFGEKVKEETYYSQAVRVGDIIEVSGQGQFPFTVSTFTL